MLLGRPCASAEVIVASTGNTALAACDLSTELGLHIRVCLPANVGAPKQAALRKAGAEIVSVKGTFAEAARTARSLAQASGARFISPGSDSLFAIGNATICAEILESVDRLDQIVVPCGGGGLIVGVGAFARSTSPDTTVTGVQLAESPYLHAIFSGVSTDRVNELPTSIEALAGELEDDALAFAELTRVCDRIVLVTEAQAMHAQTEFAERFGVTLDLGASAGLAGLGAHTDLRTCVVLTGQAR